MEYTYSLSDYYTELAQNVIADVPELNYLAEAPISIGYMESNRRKKAKGKLVFAECMKVKDVYKYFTPFDFLVVVYEPNAGLMNEEQLRILLEHELLHIRIENEDDINPIYSINPHDVEDFSSVINKYGIKWADVLDI